MPLDTAWAINEVNDFIARCEEHTNDYRRAGDAALHNSAIEAIYDDAMGRMPIIKDIADRAWPKWRDHLPKRRSFSWEYDPMLQVAKQLLVKLTRMSELEQKLGEAGTTLSAPNTRNPATNIFVVHGHDHAKLHETVRVLERATGIDATVLHEQPNAGRTILEKFEDHAVASSYAVVLLTGDDMGKALSAEELRPRGRQNVIFELGFFFGRLGRDRVIVLLGKGVEKPSDIDGLVYITFDSLGAWKQALARELEAAKIPVNYSRIP